MTAREIQCVNPLELPDWDTQAGSFEDATVFHSAAWARVLVETYAYRPRYFVARSSGVPDAILPIMDIRSLLTGRRGVSLPFADYCQPLSKSTEAWDQVNEAALAYAREAGWKYLEWRGDQGPRNGVAPSLAYWHHVIDLLPDEERQFASVKSTVRTAVRKAIAEDVKIEVSTAVDAVRAFHRLNGLTRKRHGLPPQPWTFLQNVHRHMMGDGRGVTIVARHKDRPIAASVFFRQGRRAVYKFGASDLACQHLRANDLVMWEAIRWFGQQGCAELSLGKTAQDHDGLRRFKLGWGARESEIRYYRYDLASGGFVRDRDAVDGWHNRVFRALPLPVSRLIGAALYRHVG
jgi:CelD/BcsL family acetyltransferase involved in cellulose biosynthesis